MPYFCIFAFVRVIQTSKAMQTTAIRTVANSLPKNEVILLIHLISKRYIPYTDLGKIREFPARILNKLQRTEKVRYTAS